MFREPQVNFYVDDVEAAVRFYTDHFGFKETFRTPQSGTPDHVEVTLDGFILGLASNAAARAHHGVTTGGGNPRAGVCLWTDDVDHVYSDLKARGVTPLNEPHTFLNGRLRVGWVADPEGNPIEIVTRLKTGTAS